MEEGRPVRIVFDGIAVDRLMDTAVNGEVSLGVSFQAERMNGNGSRDRLLVDASENVSALDGDGLDH